MKSTGRKWNLNRRDKCNHFTPAVCATEMVRKILLTFLLLVGPVNADLVGWWKFDEGSGIIAGDHSGFYHDGTLNNMDSNDWVEGVMGNALAFDGVDDYVSISQLESLATGALTISAWFKRAGKQPDSFTGLVFSRDGHSTAGLTLGMSTPDLAVNHELAYNWNDRIAAWGWHSELIVPDNRWVFVALVAAPTEATLYLGQDGLLSSATSQNEHRIEEFDGEIWIGRDAMSGRKRCFRGLIDNVRIYNRELDVNEIKAIYARSEGLSSPRDAQIAKYADDALEKAHERLRRIGDWRASPTLKRKHTDEITDALLVIAKAKQAKNLPSEKVLTDYYALVQQFPNCPEATDAICEIASLDKKNGLEQLNKFLDKDGNASRANRFYARLIRGSMSGADYINTTKYLKAFVDRYASAEGGLRLMSQLISDVGEIADTAEFNEALNLCAPQDANSAFRCGLFRYQTTKCVESAGFDETRKQVHEICTRYPGTKLAICAQALLADKHYKDGNYVLALTAFKPGLFDTSRRECYIIGDIYNIMKQYQLNTLRPTGVDLAKLYRAAAEHARNLRRYAVAVCCYNQAAKLMGSDLEAFEEAAGTSSCNTTPDNQVWFWSGLLAAEEGNLTAAVAEYKKFLEKDTTSALAARAYYDIARARLATEQYCEAQEAIAKAVAISPCAYVIQLAKKLKGLCSPLR